MRNPVEMSEDVATVAAVLVEVLPHERDLVVAVRADDANRRRALAQRGLELGCVEHRDERAQERLVRDPLLDARDRVLRDLADELVELVALLGRHGDEVVPQVQRARVLAVEVLDLGEELRRVAAPLELALVEVLELELAH